jgi:hypothetical protein
LLTQTENRLYSSRSSVYLLINELFGTIFSKGIAMQKTVNKRIRRVSQSFAIRLDLLEKLEAEAPKGERSAFLERLLVREFGSPARAQAN